MPRNKNQDGSQDGDQYLQMAISEVMYAMET